MHTVAIVGPLLQLHKSLSDSPADLHCLVLRAVGPIQSAVAHDLAWPGIGPITTLTYRATIDDPTRPCRFAKWALNQANAIIRKEPGIQRAGPIPHLLREPLPLQLSVLQSRRTLTPGGGKTQRQIDGRNHPVSDNASCDLVAPEAAEKVG